MLAVMQTPPLPPSGPPWWNLHYISPVLCYFLKTTLSKPIKMKNLFIHVFDAIRRLKIEHFSIEYRKSMPLKIMHLRPAASWCLDKGKTLLEEILIVRKHFIVDWQVSTCGIKLLPKATLSLSTQMQRT